MIGIAAGETLRVVFAYTGAVVAVTTAKLYVNGTVDNAITVTADTTAAGLVVATCATTGRVRGDSLTIRVTLLVDGTTYVSESLPRRVEVLPTNFGLMVINGAGQVTTSNPGGSVGDNLDVDIEETDVVISP